MTTRSHSKVIEKTLSGKDRGVPGIVTPGGDRGIRTPDLCIANAALSQLSYIPRKFFILPIASACVKPEPLIDQNPPGMIAIIDFELTTRPEPANRMTGPLI